MPRSRPGPNALLLQDVAVDLLAGATSAHGDKGRVAHEAGLHQPVISRILSRNGMPSQLTAKRIARSLPVQHTERQFWLWLVKEYWHARFTEPVQTFTPQNRFNYDEFVELRQRHMTVQYTARRTDRSTSYTSVYHEALDMIHRVQPNNESGSRVYAYLCSILNDTAQELGRKGEALLWARRGRIVAQQIEIPKDEETREIALLNQVNSLRTEAAALHEIKLDKIAHGLCEQAKLTEGFRSDPGYWSLQVTRDQLKALACIPRFRLSTAEGYVMTARRLAANSTHPAIEMLDMLLACAASEAYLAYGKPRMALAELRPWLNRLEAIPMIGPVHLVQFHKMWWESQFAIGHYDEAVHALNHARTIATTAGLHNALAKLEDLSESPKVLAADSPPPPCGGGESAGQNLWTGT
ncbi:MAG: helix-turn-helix transcriptional regulator [Chloroflexi bacterium]|nr:helix-turn-helix transcriptional regulator [Chloroflexota bacterium]